MTDRPRRGWTVWTEEVPANVMLDMPPDLSKKVLNFLVALGIEAGAAIDANREPPGDPMDDLGVRYSLEIAGESVIIEYTVIREERQIRIPVLVWFH
ncbi:hypothetical protein ACJ6WD_41010 [Streptomyces sp. VTCC 41912]|uniref:hypothetical protein n=1 Tax=Streptomyces sp. VTCC 41912 TaxID=3383243 RepID=UPI003896E3A4